ncbi:hypothetical protein [Gracilibacillus saliphilus]|uniref:hypothetical protein n=1 Tax=Gracilibacillus saliphilus TaxID=543890 RepID=UPI0013D33ACB|nr:hypothetical protein [Gracilibacillus saliphilus]
MSKKKQTFSRILQYMRHEFRYITENYMTAVKKGAKVAEKDIKKTVEGRDQPVEDIVIHLFEGIKKGVLHAAKQMIDFGDTMVKQKEKSKKK